MIPGRSERITLLAGILLASLVGAILLGAVAELPREAGGLTRVVDAHMSESGVKHPVTGVLLNFRGYDTWLELGVLLLAVFGVLLAQPADDLTRVRQLPSADPVLRRSVALLLPLAVLGCGYLLWIGKYAAGGAFQAGVVLGAALVLLWLAGSSRLVIVSPPVFRLILVAGFVAFLGTGAGLAAWGEGLLAYPVDRAGDFILFIEGCATLSIAWTMAALILGQQARGREGRTGS